MLSMRIKKAMQEHPTFKDLLIELDQGIKDRQKDNRSASQKLDQLFEERNDHNDRS